MPEEPDVVRRIFRQYVEGASPRSIAAALNADGNAAPRGPKWNASTINGNAKRGNGILQNPLYAGELIWNRVHMVKNPDTGRRISRLNTETERVCAEVPHLRIVEPEIFEAALARKERTVRAPRRAPRTPRLLSGLLRCGACGGGMSLAGRDYSGPRIQCSTHKESRSCDNGRRYYVAKIERAVVDALRKRLDAPNLLGEYLKEYRKERRRAEASARKSRAKVDRQLADLQRSVGRVIDAIADGTISKEQAATKMAELRATEDRLRAELAVADSDTNVVDLHPKAVERYRQNLDQLADVLGAALAPGDDLKRVFRSLVSSVTVLPRQPRAETQVEIKGYLRALLGWDSAIDAVAEDRSRLPPYFIKASA